MPADRASGARRASPVGPIMLELDENLVRATISKNAAASYGLTIVGGLPFPDAMTAHVLDAQQILEAAAPNRFRWYTAQQLHATLYAPLRGRYRAAPALRLDELPGDLDRFVGDLLQAARKLEPFVLDMAGARLTAEGFVMAFERTTEHPFIVGLHQYVELDTPKTVRGLHVAIGALERPEWSAPQLGSSRLRHVLDRLLDEPLGSVVVDRVWLVHYARRTLDRIVGKVPFMLGQDNSMAAERLLRDLGIE